MKKISTRFALAALLLGFMSPLARAQDFQKTYSLGAGGRLSLHNVSGDIVINGYDGSAIQVKGFKEGRDRDRVEVEDRSNANRVDLRARYPQNCNCDASIRFEVEVPRSVSYQFDPIATASGNIEVSGVKGDLAVKSASGDVRVSKATGSIRASTASGNVEVRDVAGSVNASSASGNVEVEIDRLEGNNRMEFSTASGDVSVKLPANLDADIEMSSQSGDLSTDFPIEIHSPEVGPGHRARGRLGNGSHSLRLSSASGNVRLLRL